MKERFELLVRREEGVEDLLAGQRRGERQVAAGDALAETEQVGLDALVLDGEHAPGAAEAGRDLIADQQRAVARGQRRAVRGR